LKLEELKMKGKTIQSMLNNNEVVQEVGTYNEPELNVGPIIGRVKSERINVPLLRKAAPGRTDAEILEEAGKLDDYDYDGLEEGIILENYTKRAKAHTNSSFEDRMNFREKFIAEYPEVFRRMQDRVSGAL